MTRSFNAFLNTQICCTEFLNMTTVFSFMDFFRIKIEYIIYLGQKTETSKEVLLPTLRGIFPNASKKQTVLSRNKSLLEETANTGLHHHLKFFLLILCGQEVILASINNAQRSIAVYFTMVDKLIEDKLVFIVPQQNRFFDTSTSNASNRKNLSKEVSLLFDLNSFKVSILYYVASCNFSTVFGEFVVGKTMLGQ
ncbi:hypothetical protein BY458DRAFT_550299 [Sporodiniella umbellata]|nr:hypothetical protein BY458DRAFT_550299 [Sporodiniella umbellata]